MNNKEQWLLTCLSHCGNAMIAITVVLLLASCDSSPEPPGPPPSPPRPQVLEDKFSAEVEHAVYSYSSKPAFQIQNGRGVKIERHVIHT